MMLHRLSRLCPLTIVLPLLFSVPAAAAQNPAPTDLDLQVAYCFGADLVTRDAIQSKLQDATSDTTKQPYENGLMLLLQSTAKSADRYRDYLLAKGYADFPYDSNQLSHISIPFNRGKADENAAQQTKGGTTWRKCTADCIAPQSGIDLECFRQCDKYKSDVERRLTACVDLEEQLPF
jgi:hypothetical protein